MTAENTMQWMMDFYPEIYPTRKHCLNQLFCVIGNGYKWVNGELVEKDSKSNRYKMIVDIERAHGDMEDFWWEHYRQEQELLKYLGEDGDSGSSGRQHYYLSWYPVCDLSYIFRYPDDITFSWRRALEECKLLLIEDGILDKEGNIV